VISLYVAAGGVLGALARFGVGSWLGAPTTSAFPWATFVINLTGSVLLGVLMRAFPPSELRALLAIGFCGSFTTFSTFGYELAMLIQGGAHTTAAVYALGSVVAGVAGVFLGLAIGGAIG